MIRAPVSQAIGTFRIDPGRDCRRRLRPGAACQSMRLPPRTLALLPDYSISGSTRETATRSWAMTKNILVSIHGRYYLASENRDSPTDFCLLDFFLSTAAHRRAAERNITLAARRARFMPFSTRRSCRAAACSASASSRCFCSRSSLRFRSSFCLTRAFYLYMCRGAVEWRGADDPGAL